MVKAQPDFPSGLLGIIMNTYYGGRAEIRIRRQMARVLYCDFRSMYPTVCTLMGLWRLSLQTGMTTRAMPRGNKGVTGFGQLGRPSKTGIWRV